MNKVIFPLLLLCAALSACSTQTVKTTTITPINSPQEEILENELLDVGIAVFDPGLEDIGRSEAELTFVDIRNAETYYAAQQLARTLQLNGSWGAVRVVPSDLESFDLAIRSTILHSDGETMHLHVNASDATGRVWIDKEYKEVVSKFSYDPRRRHPEDAFQGLYNKIANDLLRYRLDTISPQKAHNIRTVAQLQFARRFAPQVFDQYLEENKKGLLEIKRLPAANDPILSRIDNIRERDYLYVDTLQDFYTTFSMQMRPSYDEFRKLSYAEVIKLNKLKRDARRDMVLGVAAIVGGLAGLSSNNPAVYYGGTAGLAGGAWLIKTAFDKNAEAKLHVESLAELGNSMELEIAPQTIQLDERIVTLSGSVEEQYAQWREILADLYALETGQGENNTP